LLIEALRRRIDALHLGLARTVGLRHPAQKGQLSGTQIPHALGLLANSIGPLLVPVIQLPLGASPMHLPRSTLHLLAGGASADLTAVLLPSVAPLAHRKQLAAAPTDHEPMHHLALIGATFLATTAWLRERALVDAPSRDTEGRDG
jgi:hypothetical protein